MSATLVAVRVVVVGAGIGGLCAARAVRLAGHEAVVLERSRATTGAGLLLWPNAVRALDALGFDVRGVAGEVRTVRLRDESGRELSVNDTAELGHRAGAPMVAVERPLLHGVLSEGADVRYQAEVCGVDERGVTLTGGERVDGDAVIGADGIGSVVRGFVCGVAPIDTGFTAVRGIASYDIGAGQAYEAWGRGRLVGGVALPGQRTYWFYEARDAAGIGSVGAWPAPMPALLAATDPDAVLVNRILRLPALGTWTRGSVALLGDAAHAMEPNLGQGAAQAAEDAESLLGALRAGGPPAAILARYAEGRQRRAHMLQRESTRIARMALRLPPGPRNAITRATPPRVRRFLLERLMRS